MKKSNLFASLLLTILTFGIGSAAQAQNNYALDPLTTFGTHGDGTILPGDLFFDTAFNQRGMSYDPVSGNIVVVDTHSGSGGSNAVQGAIYVLNGDTGAQLGTLSTNGIIGGSYADTAAAIADDGVVYICNQMGSSTNLAFKIYRWSSVSDTAAPIVAFNSTIAPSQRYGESMDVRGAGTNTQIIIGSMPGGSPVSSATNVVIFTTADGTNFAANVIGCTNVLSANFNDGIAFGVSNTFWAKRIGAPLLYLAFDITNKTARTLATYYPSNMPTVLNLGPISVDNDNKLLAAIEEAGGTVGGGPERVWLYDISNTNIPPVVLSVRNFSPNNQNATAPLGFTDFGGGRLYVHDSNNGMLVSLIDSVSTPLPVFDKDLPGTNRVAVGQTAHFEVAAYPSITNYQWFTNNVVISGATNFFLDVTNVSLSDSGRVYSVVVSNPAGSSNSVNSILSVVNPGDLYHLNLVWSFNGSGNPATGGTNFFSNNGGSGTPNERSMAYNSLSNQLLVVQKPNNTTVRIFVLDANTGQVQYQLKTNNLVYTNIALSLVSIAVAPDGAVYACNVDTTNGFRIYRWADTGSNTIPAVIWGQGSSAGAGDPAHAGNPAKGITSADRRWGDAMTVRGSGTDTQIILDNQDTGTFFYMALMRPTDGTMLNWSGKGYGLQNVLGGTKIGRSLQFGDGDNFWQKRYNASGTPFVESSFDPNDNSTPPVAPTVLASTGQPLFTNGLVGADFAVNKLGAAINFTFGDAAGASPHTLDLYDLSSPATPVLLGRNNFPANATANANEIGQVIFTTNYVFALDGNNGIMAFKLASGPVPPPTILTQPANLRLLEGSSGSLSVVVDQIVTYQWRKDGLALTGSTNSSLSFANASTTNSGNYVVVATNANGSATSAVALVTVSKAIDNYTLSNYWSAAPNTQPYVTSTGGSTTPNERSFAYNALSNQLIVVRCPPSSLNYTVHVVNASSGIKLYDLRTDNVVHESGSEVSGSNPIDLLSVAVADDGAIYICNETPNASGGQTFDDTRQFRVYRWADSGPNTAPTNVFTGDPAGQSANFRWGDAMTARGSGTSTELLLDSNDGTLAAVLTPTDSTMSSFSNHPLTSTTGGGSIGRSIQFEASKTNYWQKRKGTGLVFSSYNTNAQSSALLANFTGFPLTFGGAAVDSSRNMVVGVEFVGTTGSTPDAVGLYDIADPLTPMLIKRYNFAANQSANANFICKTIIAGNKVFSFDGNNGLMAFTINGPALTATPAGPKVVISWGLFTNYTLQATPSLAQPITWTNVAPPAPINIVNGRNTVTNPASAPSLFYRLIH